MSSIYMNKLGKRNKAKANAKVETDDIILTLRTK
jgi:hypothetical protein